MRRRLTRRGSASSTSISKLPGPEMTSPRTGRRPTWVTRKPPNVSTSSPASPVTHSSPMTERTSAGPAPRTANEGISLLPAPRRRFVAAVLVVDLADDLLDNILDRDQPVGPAIFVDDQRQMDARGLHLREQIDPPHRRGHEQQFPDDVGFRKRHRQIDRAQIETGGKRLFGLGLGLRLSRRGP